jgi:hypothetical protein
MVSFLLAFPSNPEQFLFSPICVTFSVHHIFLDLSIIIISGEEYKL